MSIITLAEYARRQGRRQEVARNMARRGGFKTAYKAGNTWLIDEAEVWPDRRVKHGRYRDYWARVRAEERSRKDLEK